MNTRFGMLVALVALGMLCAIGTAAADNTTSTQGMQLANSIPPYNGPIGPDSSLYGLKLAFENLDDSFTFNQSERLEKQVGQADLRLSELEGALDANRTSAADRALDQYWQKMNQTGQTLALFNDTGYQPSFNGTYNRPVPGFNGTGYMPAYTGTGALPEDNGNGYTQVDNGNEYIPTSINPALMHAQEMILSHQVLLENLMLSHPNNPGLAQAYDNSRDLEQRFELKTQVRFDRIQDTDNRIWFQPVHVIPVTQNRTILANAQGGHVSTVNRVAPEAWNQNGEPAGHTERTGQPAVQTTQTSQDQHRPAVQVLPGHTQDPSNGQENRDVNRSWTGSTGRDTNGNSYRNSNWDTRYRNP
jgi:hypothetical protein